MGRKPGRDGARLRRDVRAQAPSEMPRGYAAAGARVGDALAAQLGRRQHRRAIDMPTTRRLSRTSNADMVAVACCKCIEDGVTTFITQIELLDRINLLINGAIGVRRATSHSNVLQTRKTRSVAEESLHHLPNPPGDGGKIANVGQSWCSYSAKCFSWTPLRDIRSSVGNGTGNMGLFGRPVWVAEKQ